MNSGGLPSSQSRLAGPNSPYLHGDNTYWRLRIASLLGEPDESMQLLRRSWREGV